MPTIVPAGNWLCFAKCGLSLSAKSADTVKETTSFSLLSWHAWPGLIIMPARGRDPSGPPTSRLQVVSVMRASKLSRICRPILILYSVVSLSYKRQDSVSREIPTMEDIFLVADGPR